MEPFTPFAGPCGNSLPPWHHSGHLDRSFNDDSGYASEDSDSAPFLPLDPDNDPEYTNHGPPWMQRHRAAAFVSAQWSHPVAFRACHPFYDSFSDSSRTYNLPPALPFEEEQDSYVPGSRPKPPTSYHCCEFFDREPDHRGDLESKISPLDFEEHRARIPDALISLSNRVIQSETDHYPFPPNSLRHDFSSPGVKIEDPQFFGSITSAQPDDDRHGNMMPCSAWQNRSSSHDAQLAAAWQQLYQERTELEKDRRALRKRQKSLFTTRGAALIDSAGSLDEMAGNGRL